MKTIDLYSQRNLTIYRILALISIIILVVSNTIIISDFGFSNLGSNIFKLFTFISNCISIILFFFVVLFPSKLEICSLIAFIDAAIILFFEPDNNLGILMYGLSMFISSARGLFNTNRKIKIILASIIFITLVLSELRFGLKFFYLSIFEKAAYIFIFFLSLFFHKISICNSIETSPSKKILNIKAYPELKKRDAEWLVKIINDEKYDILAIDSNLSLGSVKNRLKIIFDELKTGDKRGFLAKYSDYDIYFGDELISQKKEKA